MTDWESAAFVICCAVAIGAIAEAVWHAMHGGDDDDA